MKNIHEGIQVIHLYFEDNIYIYFFLFYDFEIIFQFYLELLGNIDERICVELTRQSICIIILF